MPLRDACGQPLQGIEPGALRGLQALALHHVYGPWPCERGRSFVTRRQVSTGDGWAEMSRSLFPANGFSSQVAVFFASYVVIGSDAGGREHELSEHCRRNDRRQRVCRCAAK
eukprot:746888-Hanusia_phi.AAC.7